MEPSACYGSGSRTDETLFGYTAYAIALLLEHLQRFDADFVVAFVHDGWGLVGTERASGEPNAKLFAASSCLLMCHIALNFKLGRFPRKLGI